MNDKIAKNGGSTISTKCKQCDYEVHFHLKPIPGLVKVDIPAVLPASAWLTCDNPTTPHTNKYDIPF